MKFRGDNVRPLGVCPEVVDGWEAIGGVERARAGLSPLVETVGVSGTAFRGKLVSWMPAGMVRISLPCWTLR